MIGFLGLQSCDNSKEYIFESQALYNNLGEPIESLNNFSQKVLSDSSTIKLLSNTYFNLDNDNLKTDDRCVFDPESQLLVITVNTEENGTSIIIKHIYEVDPNSCEVKLNGGSIAGRETEQEYYTYIDGAVRTNMKPPNIFYLANAGKIVADRLASQLSPLFNQKPNLHTGIPKSQRK